MRFFHWIDHLLGFAPSYIDRRMIDGHEWCVLVCKECKKEKPFFHSSVCECEKLAEAKTEGSKPR